MPTGNEITVSVTNPASLAVAVPGASSTVPTIVNGGTANVTITSVGDRGPKGDTGPAVNLTIGTVTKGTNADASITGIPPNQTLNLTLPQGDTGPAGGYTEIVAGKATTLSAGSSATVTATPSNGGATVTLDFGIPAGASGAGVTLSDATPSKLGTAAAGTASTASRSDHVHAVPTISYADLTNVPSTFAPASHTHTSASVLDFTTAAAAAAPVQTVAGRTGSVVIATSDISGLDSLLDGLVRDVVDGGDYVGVTPSPTITVTQQPASTTASTTVGVTWASTGSGNTGWRAAAWNGSRWVIVGQWFNSPSGYYTATSTDAVNWSLTAAGLTRMQFAATDVASDATRFLAVGANSYATSTDGLSWASGSLPISAGYVAYGGGRFLVAGSQSTYSTDSGATWSSPISTPAAVRAMCYGAAFAAVTSGSSATVMTSANGSSWNTATLPAAAQWQSIAYGNGRYVAVSSGTAAAYSIDGTTWSAGTLPATASLGRVVTFSAGRFLAFTYNSTAAAWSTDGATWTAITLPASGRWIDAAGDGLNVLAVEQGTGRHLYSSGSATATFTCAGIVSTGVLTYQWSVSTNAGATWTAISGATSPTLTLTGLTTADDGKRFRCTLNTVAGTPVDTNSATLTVQ